MLQIVGVYEHVETYMYNSLVVDPVHVDMLNVDDEQDQHKERPCRG